MVLTAAFSCVTDLKAAEVAELSQWLEFAADVANRRNLTDDQAMVYLQFLNENLAGRTFLTGFRSSNADATLYAVLRDYVVSRRSVFWNHIPESKLRDGIPHRGRTAHCMCLFTEEIELP